MKTRKHPKYTYVKGGIYYFSRAIPEDLRQHYDCLRVVQSLRTKSSKDARAASKILSLQLEKDWFSLRYLEGAKISSHLNHGVIQETDVLDIEGSLHQYIRVKGNNRPKTFFRNAERSDLAQ